MPYDLKGKQLKFCQEYMIDLSPRDAAIRAGYAKKSAYVTSHKLLQRPDVTELIQSLMSGRLLRVTADADYVLRRLVDIDQMDVSDIMDGKGNIFAITEWPEVWRKTLSGLEISELFENTGKVRQVIGTLKKIRWPDKLRNLELIGRHVTVGAFKDAIDLHHQGEIRTVTRTIVDPKGAK